MARARMVMLGTVAPGIMMMNGRRAIFQLMHRSIRKVGARRLRHSGPGIAVQHMNAHRHGQCRGALQRQPQHQEGNQRELEMGLHDLWKA